MIRLLRYTVYIWLLRTRNMIHLHHMRNTFIFWFIELPFFIGICNFFLLLSLSLSLFSPLSSPQLAYIIYAIALLLLISNPFHAHETLEIHNMCLVRMPYTYLHMPLPIPMPFGKLLIDIRCMPSAWYGFHCTANDLSILWSAFTINPKCFTLTKHTMNMIWIPSNRAKDLARIYSIYRFWWFVLKINKCHV